MYIVLNFETKFVIYFILITNYEKQPSLGRLARFLFLLGCGVRIKPFAFTFSQNIRINLQI